MLTANLEDSMPAKLVRRQVSRTPSTPRTSFASRMLLSDLRTWRDVKCSHPGSSEAIKRCAPCAPVASRRTGLRRSLSSRQTQDAHPTQQQRPSIPGTFSPLSASCAIFPSSRALSKWCKFTRSHTGNQDPQADNHSFVITSCRMRTYIPNSKKMKVKMKSYAKGQR